MKVPRSTSPWSARSLPRHERCPSAVPRVSVGVRVRARAWVRLRAWVRVRTGAVREKAEQGGASSVTPTSHAA